ncbi:hypothetical protein [Pantoea sp. ME81]|uniref:hypothetical protein n=1 Tax=Pantoea sp. ME81 TaxID=2743935 RepID=UPI002103D897|nr:hypothetical protein [Pantoea sp. ME81]
MRKRPFMDVWARSKQERQLSTGNEAVWRGDYKFHHAEKGLRTGATIRFSWHGARQIMN